VAAVIATTLSPSVFSPVVGLKIFSKVEISIALFSMIQATVSGLLIGILFQHFYGRTDTVVRVATPPGEIALGGALAPGH
jgi:hypothetical protein